MRFGVTYCAIVVTDDFESEDYSPAPLSEPLLRVRIETLRVPFAAAGMRLDRFLASALPNHSRSRLAELTKAGLVTVDGILALPRRLLTGGEQVVVELPPREAEMAMQPEEMPIEVVYEDDDVIVINKPPGLVVHPAAGNWHGTLMNGLLARYPSSRVVPRAGIVHRLDKDTSGLMVIARTEKAQLSLVRQLQARSVSRRYLALVTGALAGEGSIREPVGRHPHVRVKMAVVEEARGGKAAVTHYRSIERLAHHTLAECRIETGRTHQIRVHMQWLGFPLVGDPLYGGAPTKLPSPMRDAIDRFGRQALHAASLAFTHPGDGAPRCFEAPLPADYEALLLVARSSDG